MGPIFPTYLGHLHDERLSNRWFRCFAVIRLTNPPYIIIMWKISSTGYMKKKKTDFKCTVHVLIFQLSFSVCGCNQVPLDSSTSLPFSSSLIPVFFSFSPSPSSSSSCPSLHHLNQEEMECMLWPEWVLTGRLGWLDFDAGDQEWQGPQGTNTCHMSTPLPHTHSVGPTPIS